MRVSLTAPALVGLAASASVYGLPHTQQRACHETTLSTVQKTLKSAWNTFASSTLGWYDLPDVFEETLRKVEIALDEADKSVWQTLVDDDRFSKLVKLTRYDEKTQKLLDEASHGLTFFAPDNDALKRPDEHKDLEDIQPHDQDALIHLAAHHVELFEKEGGDDDDDKKKKRKEIFKKILSAILNYHIVPYNVGSIAIGINSTVPTNLVIKDGSYGGQNQRIKVEHTLVPPSITLNKFVTIKEGDIKATNGVIHVIDHPLIPPPDILTAAFLGTKVLSTFTSAVQKVGLEKAVGWTYSREDKKFVGNPIVTGFVPTNDAFDALPDKLVFYLFSPFGERALAKLLAYHLTPGYIIHSEWIYNAHEGVSAEGVELEFDYNFKTALKNHTLPVHIKKTTPTIPVPGVAYWEFTVQGNKVGDKAFDFPARNGALHILDKVLDPRKGLSSSSWNAKDKNAGDDWSDWEEWLPAWAAED